MPDATLVYHVRALKEIAAPDSGWPESLRDGAEEWLDERRLEKLEIEALAEENEKRAVREELADAGLAVDTIDRIARNADPETLRTRGYESLEVQRLDEEAEEREAKDLSEGVQRRSERSRAGVGAVAEVSSKSRSKSVRTEPTEAERRDAYAEGDVAFEDLPEKLQRKIRGH